ncbi:BOI-related E3 ubiquitin-protein ligase 1-like [Curcuma longa]|uniref:BOI-related E3 ubiquitin-protein ligase 1-like n=1 Tax=Curcuma longa TaxID=136217 RepID=UPI003D9F4D24
MMYFPQADDASAFLFANGAARNPAKRGRDSTEAPPAAAPQSHLSSLQPHPPLVSPSQLQVHLPPLVPTGIGLSCDLAVCVNQQKDEIERFLHAQGEHLRRTLERSQRSICFLLVAAKKSAALRLREKEADVERAARRSAELEHQVARLLTELMTWQERVNAGHAEVASLRAQLQQAAAALLPAKRADSAESAFSGANRVEAERACRACWCRPASVVILPCRHLCLCEVCDGGGGSADPCPVCLCDRTGEVRVLAT